MNEMISAGDFRKGITVEMDNVVFTITQRDLTSTGAMESEMENMVNYAKNIVGVEIGILLKEADDSTSKISLRSKGRIDVSLLAGQFGGGGHQAAAGASLPMDVEQARKEVLAAARKMLGAGTQ
jgi:phosphoesterase RecJ-like protein